jgi:hypothetical protein
VAGRRSTGRAADYVGQQQLLMLLLVMGSEQDHLPHGNVDVAPFEEFEHRPVDVVAIGVHLLPGRA